MIDEIRDVIQKQEQTFKPLLRRVAAAAAARPLQTSVVGHQISTAEGRQQTKPASRPCEIEPYTGNGEDDELC